MPMAAPTLDGIGCRSAMAVFGHVFAECVQGIVPTIT